jgi:hypothetical protein
MEPAVLTAFANMVRAGMPPRIVIEALIQGGRLPEDTDADLLEAEWLGHVAANEDAARAEAMSKADALPPDLADAA